MTLLDFRIEGKTPCEKERLNSSDNWFEILLLSNFKIFVGILLGPTAFRGLRDKIIFLISILSTGFMEKELISISPFQVVFKSLIFVWKEFVKYDCLFLFSKVHKRFLYCLYLKWALFFKSSFSFMNFDSNLFFTEIDFCMSDIIQVYF